MHGDLLDLALIVVAVAFAVSGYRQGFIVGALSFIGFVGGAFLGAQFGPTIAKALVSGSTQQDIIAVVLLIGFAILGQFIASSVGTALRQGITSRSSTTVDSVGGSAVSILSMLLIAWSIGSVLTASQFPVVVQQVNNSAVLKTMDTVMPSPAKTMFSDFRRMLASGPFPQVFSGIGSTRLLSVPAPDPNVVNSPGYDAARSRVVKIQGTAPSCNRDIEGSGFVYAPDHIITNAHVVAGVNGGPVVSTMSGTQYHAQVVFYDPQVDIAVLDVPGLNLAPLSFANPPGKAGDSAVVAGYPLNHPFTQVPARIGDVQEAQGPDIYQTGTVNRQIYELKGVVQPGNSGGPLLSPNGTVYGVIFAAAVGQSDTGFALTASEVAADANSGRTATTPVSTQGCD